MNNFILGCAYRIITPPIGTLLYGYPNKRPADKVNDDLRCNVMTFGYGSPDSVLISMDLCSFPEPVANRLADEINSHTNIAKETEGGGYTEAYSKSNNRVKFENGISSTWSQEQVVGDYDWVIESGDLANPSGTTSGSKRVAFRNNTNQTTAYITRLVLPEMNLAKVFQPILCYFFSFMPKISIRKTLSHAKLLNFNTKN